MRVAYIAFFIIFILAWINFLVAILTRRSAAFRKFAYAFVGINIMALAALIVMGRVGR